MFQLVRRTTPLQAIQQANARAKPFTTRESFLSTALLSVLSVNVFMLAGVLSFCTFVFWYPQ